MIEKMHELTEEEMAHRIMKREHAHAPKPFFVCFVWTRDYGESQCEMNQVIKTEDER